MGRTGEMVREKILEVKKVFPLPLRGEYIGKGVWELTESFKYNNPPFFILIPVGFKSDGASIPKLFWSVIGSPWTGKYGFAALTHDYLYHIQLYTRQESDLEFYRAMQVLKVPWIKRWLIYHSVRTWGHFPWRHHKKRLEKKLEAIDADNKKNTQAPKTNTEESNA